MNDDVRRVKREAQQYLTEQEEAAFRHDQLMQEIDDEVLGVWSGQGGKEGADGLAGPVAQDDLLPGQLWRVLVPGATPGRRGRGWLLLRPAIVHRWPRPTDHVRLAVGGSRTVGAAGRGLGRGDVAAASALTPR